MHCGVNDGSQQPTAPGAEAQDQSFLDKTTPEYFFAGASDKQQDRGNRYRLTLGADVVNRGDLRMGKRKQKLRQAVADPEDGI